MAFSVDRVRKIFVAGVASGVLVSGLVAAPIAEAYPPGKKATVLTNKVKYRPGARVKARAQRVKPGCKVRFHWKGKGFSRFRTRKANAKGRAQASIKHGPRKPGKYRVHILVLKTKKCSAEKSRTTFRVRKGKGRGRG